MIRLTRLKFGLLALAMSGLLVGCDSNSISKVTLAKVRLCGDGNGQLGLSGISVWQDGNGTWRMRLPQPTVEGWDDASVWWQVWYWVDRNGNGTLDPGEGIATATSGNSPPPGEPNPDPNCPSDQWGADHPTDNKKVRVYWKIRKLTPNGPDNDEGDAEVGVRHPRTK